jgi:hypothetical protein
MRLLPANQQHCVEFRNLKFARVVTINFQEVEMNSLVRLLVLAVVSFALGTFSTPSGFAQAKPAAGKTTVTGCLQKGDEANEFSITGEDGKTYGLRSSAVDLSKHLGHKVTVTGRLKAESYEKEKGESEEHEKKEGAEAGDIRVTNLKMVSDSCK